MSTLQLLSLAALIALPAPPSETLVTETLARDQTAPRIGSIKIDVHGNGRATASWRTDEPARSVLTFGSTLDEIRTLRDESLVLEHSFELTGLVHHERYYYVAESADAAGNETQAALAKFISGGATAGIGFEVSGRMQAWFPTTLSFEGPATHENATAPNPFLGYRLNVVLTSPSGQSGVVPGYYDGDGDGGGSGNIWRTRFAAHQAGTWSFVAHFDAGTNVAVSTDPTAGTPTSFDGTSGTFEIFPRDPAAPGFYKWGKLVYTGEHYLKFYDGPYFIKGGTDSPENLLGFAGFDNTIDQGGISVPLVNGLHHYTPHVDDWGPAAGGGLGTEADPLFVSETTGIDSRGLIGALNYLRSVRINSLYFLPMNLGGDGWETCPFVGYPKTRHNKTHYDISKLDQWQETLEHAAQRGLMIQFVLSETETANETWLDEGALGIERKLFYREMVARFGHLPAIKWNLAEESDFSTSVIQSFAGYIAQLDLYGHPIGFHSHVLPASGEYAPWTAVLGDPRFSTNSIQGIPYSAGTVVEKWRADSAAAGRPWIVDFDEQIQALVATNAADLRKLMLYDVLFSGGHVEWYAGYNPLPLGGDLSLEDFRTREEMWNYTRYAREFLESNVPFWLMDPADELVAGESPTHGGAEVLALRGQQYAIHFGEASQTGTLDLRTVGGFYRMSWFNPRTGNFEGTSTRVAGRQLVPLGAPPAAPSEDWVLLVQREIVGSN